MKWGPKPGEKVSNGQFLERLAQADGIESSATKTRPSLDTIESHYWSCYQLLHGARGSNGFGPTPIQISEIVVYAEHLRMSDDERQDFVHIMTTLDRNFLELVRKK